MCLLAVACRTVPGAPLLVGANRDELIARPAVAMAVLRDATPRVLGGRDEQAGGTWLAVNEHGLVVGLTNLPAAGGRDPSKKSRGELPLLASVHTSAEAAARALGRDLRAEQYNPCWMLLADRNGAWYIDVTGFGPPGAVPLGTGLWVLENRAILSDSPKADLVRMELAREKLDGDDWAESLASVFRSHDIPERSRRSSAGIRPPEADAACVHVGPYGTRTFAAIRVGETGLPQVRYTDGPPCTNDLKDATPLWAKS